ncbi:MAG: DUF3850 domain-containing protein [Firmicutes bacterium]|nr:DUF3850 domain-containing protein [Bacillota bacterium]
MNLIQEATVFTTDHGDIRLHQLKTWPEYFDAVKSGDKKVEIRKRDREFQVGDVLWLIRYNPETNELGEAIFYRVTHILDAQPFVPEGYIAMSIEPTEMEIRF